MGKITVLNRKGDEAIEWDPNDEESVEAARAQFNELKEQGYSFFHEERVDEFDPSLENITAVAPMAGG